MKKFLTIYLPWIGSLAAVFYLGLNLGSSSTAERISQNANKSSSGKWLPSTTRTESSKSEHGQEEYAPVPKNSFLKKVDNLALPPNLKRIMEGGDMIERMGAYLDAVRAMDKGNTFEVVSAFEALPKGYGRHLEMKLLMRSWAAIDPEAALAYANESLDLKSERRFGISEVLAGWANQDPKGALQWAQANNSSDKPEDNPLILGVIKGIAENNLEEANKIFKDLPEGNARWQASTFLAQKYSEMGLEKAIEWLDQFPTEDERMHEMIFGQAGARLARQDLSGTAQWVESMKVGKASLRVMDNLINQWVSKDANSAAQWLNDLPAGEKKFYGMKQLTSRWSLSDPIATAQWLNSFPPSSKMDPVVNEFVNRISARDPEGAAGWAMSIVDPKIKERAVKKAIAAWTRMNPEKANQWKNSNFPNLK